jgi:DNA/RNA-binding domain of Phe-tRNA-synthetase-like protein
VALYPAMRFTAVTATDVNLGAFEKQVRAFAERTVKSLSAKDESRQMNLNEFERFFKINNQEFPLAKQIARAASRGFPPVPNPVLALLALEAATGILMGVQNLDAIDSFITLDCLESTESFIGMRGERVTSTMGQIVVRDKQSIIASLFRGPDKRTAVHPNGRNLLFYVFDTDTGLGESHDRAVGEITRLFPPNVGEASVLTAS